MRRRGHPARVSPSALLGAGLRPFRRGPSGSRASGTSKLGPFQRQSQQAQNPVTGPGGRATLGALEAVELALGEVEQGSGLDERQVVLHPKGAEAGAEVVRAESRAQQKVEGVAGVVADVFA